MTLAADLLAEGQAAGGTSWFLPVMLVVMVLLLWLPMRRQKKAQAQMKQKQATMQPGTKVMTSFGLFGTLVSMDREQNKAVLEIAPGMLVDVHSQTVTTVVEEPESAVVADSAAVTETSTDSVAPAAGATSATTDVTEVDPLADDAAADRKTWRDSRGDNPTA